MSIYPYSIEQRTRDDWSPAMRELANRVMEEYQQAKPEDRKRIQISFEQWIKDHPELQF